MKKLISAVLCISVVFSAIVNGIVSTSADDDTSFAAVGVTLDDPLVAPRIVVTTEEGNGTTLLKEDGYQQATITITDTDGSVLTDA